MELINHNKSTSLGFAFSFYWLIATTFGWLIGVIVSESFVADLLTVIILSLPPFSLLLSNKIGQFVGLLSWGMVIQSVHWGLIGLITSYFQWWVVHRRFLWSKLWIVVSVGGWVGGGMLCALWRSVDTFFLETSQQSVPVSAFFIQLAIIGTTVGVAEWLVLRRFYLWSGWWVIVYNISLAFGGIIAEKGAFRLLEAYSIPTYSYHITDSTTIWFDSVWGIILGCIVGVTTGQMIILLTKFSQQSKGIQISDE